MPGKNPRTAKNKATKKLKELYEKNGVKKTPISKTGKKKKSADSPKKRRVSSKKTSRHNGDKEKVKRPRSAYIFFCIETSSNLKSTGAEKAIMPIKGRQGKIAKRWKNLDDNEKAKYITLAEKDKVRYQQEINKKDG